MVPTIVLVTKETPAMVPNCHPHVAILIVTVERRVSAAKDCLQRCLSKQTELIMRPNKKKTNVLSPHEQHGSR